MKEAVKISILPAAERRRVGGLWRAVEARAGAVALASSWSWTETWLRHYGDAVVHRFAVGEAAGREVGLALIAEDMRGRRPLRRRLAHIGTAGEPAGEGVFVERNGILAEPGFGPGFAGALVGRLAAEGRWDGLALDGFRPEEAAWLLDAEPRLVTRAEACPYLDLRGVVDVDGVLGLLRSGPRRKIRKSLRDFGALETQWARTPAEALEVLAELGALNRARWERVGQRSAFASARFEAFHNDLVSRLAPDSAVLFRARAGSETVGCLYLLVDANDLLLYQTGYRPFDDKRLRPGFATNLLCMAAGAARGFWGYDMLAGDAWYKRQLTSSERALVWGRAAWRRSATRTLVRVARAAGADAGG